MPKFTFAAASNKTGEILKAGFNSIGEVWDWIRETDSDAFVTLVDANNKV